MTTGLPARWVLASSNRGKLRELEALLGSLNLTLVPQDALGITPAEETGLTFVENALLKARHAAKLASLPAIADDSGLVVDALRGQPGIRSARYAGANAGDADNIRKLLKALRGADPAHRGASFHCVVVALPHATDPVPIIAHGTWPGRIAESPRGTGGFGYDPIFLGQGFDQTAAELPGHVKNRVSHRARALAALIEAFGAER